jgi:dienelactone hydrolase
MNQTLRNAIAFAALAGTLGTNAQRYLTDVFTDAQITITPDVVFGQNIDFLTSDFSDISVFGPEVVQLQGLVSGQQPIPPEFFNPQDPATAVKVANLRMDVYQPDPAQDALDARPVVLVVHTGNALPPPINGSPNGTRKDSSLVEVCKRMAKRGFVAISMSYRGGWNPLATTEEERRASLLNAIYRAIHDVKQCIRTAKADAAGANPYGIDASRIVLYGEGTGGYIALGTATLNHPAELYIEKFRTDPFDPTTSYIDSTKVGNIEGFGGQLTLYRPNGQNSDFNFCVNAGGALADTSWLEAGDVPMVAFHTVFDPFAPFTEGIVIVPTTGGPVVPVQGSNFFMQLVNDYGNNASFAALASDPWTDRARALYGSTQVHSGSTVSIRSGTEGLYPLVTTDWPALAPGTQEEASPWQWWDQNSALAQTIVVPPNITANMASLSSNPNSSPTKGRAVIDTIVNYMSPRIVCALELGPCGLLPQDCLGVPGGAALPGSACDDGNPNSTGDTWNAQCECIGIQIGIAENAASAGLHMQPNPVHDVLRVTSENETMLSYALFDATGRRVRTAGVNARNFVVDRSGLQAGAYFMTIRFADSNVTRKLHLD